MTATPARKRRRPLITGCVSLVAIAVATLAIVGYVWGPSAAIVFTGSPHYPFPPTPQKYAKDVVRAAGLAGIYASSDEFASARKDALEQVKGASSYEDTYGPLREVVKAAGGKHSDILPPGSESDEGAAPAPPTVVPRGDIAIASVPEVSRHDDSQGYANRLTDGILAHARCGAVVDLRGNGGGDMGPMLAGLSPLVPDGVALSFVGPGRTADVTVNGNAVTGGGTAVTTHGGKRQVPVAVLVDASTASSAEATMLAFRGLESSRSFGVPTAGYASANIAVDLHDGETMLLTTAKDKDRTGEEFAEDPIAPDVASDNAEADALSWLEEQGCSPS